MLEQFRVVSYRILVELPTGSIGFGDLVLYHYVRVFS